MRLELDEGPRLPDWRLVMERRQGRWASVKSAGIRKEAVYSTENRPTGLDFSTDAGAPPVIVLDLHRTLTPAHGFPLLPPYHGVAQALGKWAAQNVILVISTAALSPYHPQQVLDARERLTWAWVTQYGLPITMVTGKVGAHVYYDDRMVPVAADSDNPWADVVPGVEDQLAQRAELGDDGMWRLIALPDIGDPIEDFPDEGEVPPDQPRGYSTPVLDVDVHRCLVQANSSTMEDGLKVGARESVNAIYNGNFTVHLSCAGWDPSTHKPDVSGDRLRGLQRTARINGVAYDQFVAKVHGTVFVDDKGITHTSWKKDFPLLIAALSTPQPEDEVTLQQPEVSADE